MSEPNDQEASSLTRAGIGVQCVWPRPNASAALEREELHVWCACLDPPEPDVRRMELWLSADERGKASRFRFEHDRRRFVVRRALLRALLSHYLDVQPRRMTFVYGAQVKPALAPAVAVPGIHFNLSHSGDLVLYALARDREVGVDVERIRPLPDAEAIARRYFSPAENAALERVVPAQRVEAFFNCWTRKEAFVKATGEGLERRLDSFEVSVAPDAPAHLLTAPDCAGIGPWSMSHLTPAPGFLGAVAAAGERWALRCWQYPPFIPAP